MNIICLIANLTTNPGEARTVKNGDKETHVIDLRVAYNDPFASKDTPPDYFDVTVWGEQAKACAQYLRKGREVSIEGRVKHTPWKGQHDETHNDVKIVARRVEFLRIPQGKGQHEQAAAQQEEEIAF